MKLAQLATHLQNGGHVKRTSNDTVWGLDAAATRSAPYVTRWTFWHLLGVPIRPGMPTALTGADIAATDWMAI